MISSKLEKSAKINFIFDLIFEKLINTVIQKKEEKIQMLENINKLDFLIK